MRARAPGVGGDRADRAVADKLQRQPFATLQRRPEQRDRPKYTVYRSRPLTKPGVYTLRVTHDGFEASESKKVQVRANEELTFDVVLSAEPQIEMGDVAMPEESPADPQR